MTVIDILEKLESDNSRLFKEELLETHRKNELLRRVFTIVSDPYTNFYVAKFKQPKPGVKQEEDDLVIESFLSLLEEALATRHITGNEAKGAVEQFFAMLDERQSKWCTRILLKNLRCGVQETTVNKIWPNTIKKFSVQLADSLKSHFEKGNGIVIDESVEYPIRVEPKLDGLRCVAVKCKGEVTMFTRNGTVLETLPTIKAALENSSWDNFVLDGEAMGSDWNETASVVMSHKKSKDDSGIIFHVFDAISFDTWENQSASPPLHERLELVKNLLSELQSSERVKCVEGITAKNEAELLSFYSDCMEKGYEGVMLKARNASYCFKRSSAVLKLKPTTTYEGVVVGSYEGRRGSKREGMWGGFEIVLPNGVVTRVGGGFTDKLKAEINIDQSAWIGRVIEVEGQPDPQTKDGLTKDGRVRFPVFVRTRDQNDVDPKVTAAGERFLKAS